MGIVKQQLITEHPFTLAEAWQDAVMVAEVRDPFGDYHEGSEAPHECNTYWQTNGDTTGPKHSTLWTGHAWRKSNNLYCEGCYRKRTRRYVEQLVQEAQKYPTWDQRLTHSTITEADYKRFTGRWRKQNKRKDTNNVWKAFPQQTGDIVIFHNRPADLPGETIPDNRPNLFKLVYSLAQTPEGRNVTGSGGFGGDYAGSRGQGNKKDKKKKSQTSQQIVIRGDNYTIMVKAALEHGLIANSKKPKRGKVEYKKDTTWPAYIEALEAAKIKWTVVKGKDALDKLLRGEAVQMPLDVTEESEGWQTKLSAKPDTTGKGQKWERIEANQTPLNLVDWGGGR